MQQETRRMQPDERLQLKLQPIFKMQLHTPFPRLMACRLCCSTLKAA
jgi:hypothetical protein